MRNENEKKGENNKIMFRTVIGSEQSNGKSVTQLEGLPDPFNDSDNPL